MTANAPVKSFEGIVGNRLNTQGLIGALKSGRSRASGRARAVVANPIEEQEFHKKGGGAMHTAANWFEIYLAHLEAADPCTGLAASLFCPRRVRERDSG